MKRPMAIPLTVVLLCLLVVVIACHKTAATPTPDPELQVLGERFLTEQVGEAYYQEHYHIRNIKRYAAEDLYITQRGPSQSDIIQYTVRYTYLPFVEDYVMLFFVNADTEQLMSEAFVVQEQNNARHIGGYQLRDVLLEPQAFEVTAEQAVGIAVDNGVEPLPEDTMIKAYLYSEKNELPRFCWRVTNPEQIPDDPDFAYPHCQYIVYVDVETGTVYTDIGCVDEMH